MAKYKTKDRYKKGDKVVYQIDYGASPMLAKSKAEKSKEKIGRISKVTKDQITGNLKYVIDGISIYYTNVLGLAENKINETLYLFSTPGGKYNDWKWKSMWTNLKKVRGEKEAQKIASELRNKPYHSGKEDSGFALVSSDGKTTKLVKILDENKQQGENKMKIKMSELKAMIGEIIKEEETEYQKFFKGKLGGRNLGDMSDEEKKAFFNDVDKEWKGKSETSETLEPVSPAAGNPLKRVKAKKRDQILASEQVKVEEYIRKVIREELTFLMYNDEKDGHIASRKVQKKRKRMGVGV